MGTDETIEYKWKKKKKKVGGKAKEVVLLEKQNYEMQFLSFQNFEECEKNVLENQNQKLCKRNFTH